MEKDEKQIRESVNELFRLYEEHGHQEYGEGVTQLMHMTQCAKLAEKEGSRDELVLAAFFHDIGHFLENAEDMDVYGKRDHDRLGSEFLQKYGFPEKMARLVASHVAAKRYLTYKMPGYYEKLSDASKRTLEFQGGPMRPEEARAFEADPLFDEYIKIREWDDLGKETAVPADPADLERLKEMTVNYLLNIDETA